MEWFSTFFYDYFVQFCLVAIMVGLGLNLSIKDLVRVVTFPKAVTIGLIGQIILMPAFAFALVIAFQPDPIIAIGVILLAACPGGITSNGYTLVGRGDVALSVTLTTFSSFIAVVSLPLYTYLAFRLFAQGGGDVEVPVGDMMRSLALLTVIPVLGGMLVRGYFPAFADRIKEPVRKTAFIFLLTVIVGNTVASFDRLMANVLEAGLMAAILCFGTMGMGFGLAKLFRLPVEQVIAITFEIGIQNMSIVFALAGAVLGNVEYSTFAVVYSLFVKIGPLSFLAYAKKMLADARKEGAVPVPGN